MTSLLNPKIGVCHLTVLPAFIPTDGNILGTTADRGCAKAMQATTAAVLIGFGVRMAAEAR